jgi:hypothetical protein
LDSLSLYKINSKFGEFIIKSSSPSAKIIMKLFYNYSCDKENIQLLDFCEIVKKEGYSAEIFKCDDILRPLSKEIDSAYKEVAPATISIPYTEPTLESYMPELYRMRTYEFKARPEYSFTDVRLVTSTMGSEVVRCVVKFTWKDGRISIVNLGVSAIYDERLSGRCTIPIERLKVIEFIDYCFQIYLTKDDDKYGLFHFDHRIKFMRG